MTLYDIIYMKNLIIYTTGELDWPTESKNHDS